MNDNELAKIFKAKRQKVKINQDGSFRTSFGFDRTTFEQFKAWFNIDVFNGGCYYCSITNQQSSALYELQIINSRFNATRGGKRGKRLELDRRIPTLPYDDLTNLVWCCYWCNNAKSNFFSEEEFRPIGKTIGIALNSILNSSKPSFSKDISIPL